MIKKVSFILLILTTLISYAQESLIFKTEFKPDKNYTTVLKTTSYAEVQFIADKETIDEIKSQGIELPMITESEMNLSTELSTGALAENGEFPAIIQYGAMISTNTISGKTTSEENPYSGMKVLGRYYDGNKFKIDTIIGNKVTQQMRSTLKATLENLQEVIKFPDEPMQVGDTFKSETPMTIPIEGMSPLSVKINIEYLLTDIQENKAYFNIKQSVGLDMSQEQINFTANGTGTGTSEYNIKENYLTNYNTELPMEMTIKLNEKISIECKMITTYEQDVVIE